jgi:TnpA family transposase
MAPERRYPILAAFLVATAVGIVDEVVGMFDLALGGTDKRARKILAERRLAIAEANLERLVLLDEILDVVLDDDLDDPEVGGRVRGLGRDRLTGAVRSDEERGASDGGYLELIEARYSYVRSFAPHALGALTFAASVSPSEILDAVQLLQNLNAEGRRQVPAGTPAGFVPARWGSYLSHAKTCGDEKRYNHYWELCVLFALQGALRSGEIWVEGSRRYANLASYLIPPAVWPTKRAEVLELTGQPGTFADRLARIDLDLARYLDDLEALLSDGEGPVRLDENGELHLSPLAAETVDPAAAAEKDRVLARLPMVPLAEILIDVDRETGFSRCLTHAAGSAPRTSELEHRRNLYAAILSEANNFGNTRMAELTGISPDTLDWYVHWYLRDDVTLDAAGARIVNAHHRRSLAAAWGGGTLSSSDGLRLPMRGKSLTARALSRFFLEEGVTTYTHVSDQYSIYGTQVIVPTERDGLFTLDEILGNTTELPILEHATDTHGQMLATFALFDLVGLILSPRIAGLTDRQLWRPHPPSAYTRWPRAGPLLAHHAQTGLIDEHWDDLARVGGSLKLGHVSAALLAAKLQARARQHPLAKALLEHGKLLRTVHALRWFTDEAFRRRIGRQLNKGESLNDLRRFLAFAHSGTMRYRHHHDQTAQARCLTLVTNACVLSTTDYIQDALDAEHAAGHDVSDEAIARISPGHFAAINPYGTHPIDVAAVLSRGQRRPLRKAKALNRAAAPPTKH